MFEVREKLNEFINENNVKIWTTKQL
jgi:hypothetical protein